MSITRAVKPIGSPEYVITDYSRKQLPEQLHYSRRHHVRAAARDCYTTYYLPPAIQVRKYVGI